MSHIGLRCTSCGTSHPADMRTLTCRDCGAPLDVEYIRVTDAGVPRDNTVGPMPSPLHQSSSAVSLGEGDTPCVELPAAGGLIGLRRLYGKLEFLNPTGSFKDRGTAVMMAVAGEHGVTELVEDSSGNAGASVAAYAARAGIRAHIFVPADAPGAKLRQIKAHGAEVHTIGGTRDDTVAAAVAFHNERGLVYASHALSPYFLEGTKTFAYEVARQFDEGRPDHIVFPVGNGSLFIGTWKGFDEMLQAGRIARAPRLHCVQASAVMPVVAAYEGREWGPVPPSRTAAGGIAVTAPARKRQVLGVLRAGGGAAVAVDDADILRWQRLLAEKEGIFAEPTSAVAFAGVERLRELGTIGASDSVLVPITGSGLKDSAPD